MKGPYLPYNARVVFPSGRPEIPLLKLPTPSPSEDKEEPEICMRVEES
jgi:hypothetical protein